MTVVADASPLIFLGKIGQLELIPALFNGAVWIPSSVRDEVLAPPGSPAETRMLRAFLDRCEVVKVSHPTHFSSAMSHADNDALTLALRKHADLLLTDERLLRDMAVIEQIRPIGTLGVLLRAMRKGLLTAAETRRHIDALIRDHRFRIGIALYEAVLAHLAGGK
jgi:predicted nucleic acid-binding protein